MAIDIEIFDDRIESLKAELEKYGKDIVTLISAIYGSYESGPTFDLKNNSFQVINLLKQEAIQMIHECEEDQQNKKQYEADLQKCLEMSNALLSIAKICGSLRAFEQALSKLHLVKCCGMLREIEADLTQLPPPSSLFGSGRVCVVLRNESRLCKSRLKSLLRRLIFEAITFENGNVVVMKALSGYLKAEDRVIDEPLALSELWEAIVYTDYTEELTELILKDIWKYLFVPLWKEKKAIAPDINLSPERAELTLASVARGHVIDLASATNNISPNQSLPALGQCKMPVSELFDHLGNLLAFFWTHLFTANAQVAATAGGILLLDPFNLATVLTELISNAMPKLESDLPHFKRPLEEVTKNLEWKLETYFKFSWNMQNNRLVQQQQQFTGKLTADFLTQHLNNLSSIFAAIRRREILKHAREIVLSDYHNTMIASGDALEDELSSAGDIGDPKAILDQSGSFAIQKLKFDSCQISLASCRLLKFVHEVMKQATRASPSIANVLFHSARDCLEIFIAIVPIKFADTVNTIPRMGAIFYNDCLYIAHNTILLTHKYREEMKPVDPVLQECIGFIDFIPRLRKLGDACITNHLQQQQSLIKDMIERIKITPDRQQQQQQSSSSSSAPGGSSGSGGILGLKIADKIKSKFLSASSSSSNPNDTNGVPVTVGTQQFLSMEDDGANDENRALMLVNHLERLSTQWLGVFQEIAYQRIMNLLMEKILTSIMAPVLETECITETACGEINRVYKIIQRTKAFLPTDETAQHKPTCPSWEKFLALTDLLDYNLNDIADGLSRKKFISFTSVEMTKLVKALFEDSPRRQSLLQSIAEVATSATTSNTSSNTTSIASSGGASSTTSTTFS